MWLTAVPLLLLPACWLMLLASQYRPLMVLGRGASLVLVAAACTTAVITLLRRQPASPPTLAGLARSPAWWAVLALAWQLAVYLLVAPVWMPGLPWLTERGAALACAWGLGIYLGCRGLVRAGWGLCAAGAVLLIIAAVSVLWPFPFPNGLGREAPFGLSNFNVAAGMPLMGMAGILWLRERTVRPGWPMHLLMGVGVVALVLVALRARLDGHTLHCSLQESVRGAFVELAAMAGVSLLGLLPRRMHLVALLAGVLALLGGEAVVSSGLVATTHYSPSSLQRVHLWRSAAEAIRSAPLCGYGVGAAIAVLDQQPSFSDVWMAVPSYPEHAHQEALEVLLDGGLVNLLLLGVLLWTTLAPLWRRRDEPLCQALLVAWAGLLSHAMLEVNLSQPGPVLMLALLTGVSWACIRCPGVPAPPAPAPAPLPAGGVHAWSLAQGGASLGAAAALGAFMVGEMHGHLGTLKVGSVVELQARCIADVTVAQHHGERATIRALIQELVDALGPLDNLRYQQACSERGLGSDHLQPAIEFALAQARMLPVFVPNLRLLEHLGLECEHRQDQWNAERIGDALVVAAAAARVCLAEVPENAKNQGDRRALEQFLAHQPSTPTSSTSAPAATP